jgi:transcriptional regulator with XRE-family HTH domain
MGGKIPRPIRLQVIRTWLEGKSRDKIAKELGISTGAVSNIIKDFRKDDPQFDLLREVAVKLKDQNMDIQFFAPLVRVYEALREKGLLTRITGQESLELMQDRLEGLIVALEVFCFKEHLSIQDFVSLITNMYSTADKLGIPLYRFPAYIIELKNGIDALRKEIDQIETKKQDALKDYGVTIELLQEYNANKPFLVHIQNLEQQVSDTEEKLQKYKQDLESEEFWDEIGEMFMWSISENELVKARMELGLGRYSDGKPGLSPAYLKDMVMDVFNHPSKYVDVIGEMMDIYNLQPKTTRSSTN